MKHSSSEFTRKYLTFQIVIVRGRQPLTETENDHKRWPDISGQPCRATGGLVAYFVSTRSQLCLLSEKTVRYELMFVQNGNYYFTAVGIVDTCQVNFCVLIEGWLRLEKMFRWHPRKDWTCVNCRKVGFDGKCGPIVP